jgi:alpha-tubulin suppressor-like RCC1 family protein
MVASTAAPVAQITQIAMGGLMTCTLYGRTTYCRGANDSNQLGNPAGQTGPTEVAVQGLPASGLDALETAYDSTCGITLIPDAGAVSNVYCWGTNGESELGRPFGGPFATIAGPVTGILDGGPTGAIPDAIAIAGGGNHHCALTSGHQILCWGGTEFYESGPLQGPTSCPGGDETTCSDQPQPVTLPGGEVPVGIALGSVHSCALAMSGRVYCWGWDNANQLGNTTVTQTCTDGDQTTGPCTGTPVEVTGLSGIQRLRAGGAETCGLDQAHHAYCWGYNGDGELGVGSTAPLTAPGEVVNALDEPYTFDDLAVGAEGACGRSGNTLYCWGNGVLGTEAPDGATPDNTFPAPVRF